MSLRGGGACASQRPQQSVQLSTLLVSNQFEITLSSNIQTVSKNAEDCQAKYKEINHALLCLLSLNIELNNLTHSQNQLSKQVPNLEKALTTLLEACLLLAHFQLKSMALQFASKLSRTIFWHYCQAKSIKDGMQQAYINILNKIENQNTSENHFYKSMIEFEIAVCKMVFTILPNDFQEGLEIIAMFTSVNQILLNTLNKTMKETIKGGIVQSIRDATKVQYRKIYKQLYNIEEIKWWCITELRQQTKTVKEILQAIQDFQNELSKLDYYVQLTWVMALCQIVSYAPQISDDQLQLESPEIQELIDMRCLTKLRDDYYVTLNFYKLKDTRCQALQEKLPQLMSLQQVQEQFIAKDRFFNKLYDNKEEIRLQTKPEQQIKSIFQYLFSLFTECDIEINIDLIRKVNQQFSEMNENITLIKQISLSKWIKMCETKSFNDTVVFGEFEQKQKQVQHLLSQVKGIQKFLIQLDFIFTQWDMAQLIVDDDDKLKNQQDIFKENSENQSDCQKITQSNLENFNQLQLLCIQFDVYFQATKEFVEKQYQQVHQIVQTTQSTDPILTLYKQYKDVQDIVQLCFRKLNDKILFFRDIFIHISEMIKPIEASCILKFYNVSLKLQQFDIIAPYFEYRNQDHQNLFFIQNYEKLVVKNSINFLHKEFKDMVSNSQFQDYEQAKLYLKSILQLCNYLEVQLSQNKKLTKHIHNYKLSIQVENESSKYGDLLNQWNSIQQINATLDQQQFDQSLFLVKFTQLQEKYDNILKMNAQIRWPFNQYITQYFKMIAQLDTLFLELKTFKQYDANSDANTLNRYENLRRNLKQISQSQIQRIKSTQEQYMQGADQLQMRLDRLEQSSNDELMGLLIIMQEALNETLTLIQTRMVSSQQQSIGTLNLISNQRLVDFENLYDYKTTSEDMVISSYIKFNFNFIEQNAIMEAIKQDQSGSSNLHIVQLGNQSESLRIVMILHLFNIWNSCLGGNECGIISCLILQIRLNESSNVIKKELKTTYKKELEQIIQMTFQESLLYVEQDLREKIHERNQLSFQIKYEPSFENSQLLSEKFHKLTSQISTVFSNLQELELEYDLKTPLYNQLMHEFKKAEQSTSTLDVSEIRFFQGRQLTELFLLRMDHVQRNIKTHQIKNTYVELECQKKGEIKMLFSTKENKNGLLDKFLEEQQLNSLLLLHGESGSGKSVAIKMIEDSVWRRNDPIKIIPIIVKLSELKDPINNAITETLRSLNYKLDNSQIEQLSKDVKLNKMQILFIFEEYDKLSQEYINVNIFKSNNLAQWKTPCLTNSPRYILVTRSEMFKYHDHLRWIDEEEADSIHENYWNVRILPFEVEQKTQFLVKFQELNIRITALEFYSMICDFEHQDLLMQNFISMWKKIDINLNDLSVDNALITSSTINKIVSAFKNDSKIKFTDELMFQSLTVRLEALRSNYYYQRMLEAVNYSQQIDNAQILLVFVVALPKLLKIMSTVERVKESFFEIYQNENYTLSCDTKQVKIQLERDWNQLFNSQFFKSYKVEEGITKTQIVLAQCFSDDPQFQNKILKIFEKISITHYDLYEQYLSNYFETAILRVQTKEKDLNIDRFKLEQWNFSINLAVKLSYHEIFSVHFNSQGSLIKIGGSASDWEEFFNDDDFLINSIAISKRILRQAIPLREQFSIFAFENKIIQEFLVAKSIVNEIESCSTKTIEQAMQNSILKVKNISSPFFHGTVNFIVQKCSKRFTLKQYLVEIIKQSAKIDSYTLLSSNAFYLLLKIDGTIFGVDFNNIKLKDLHLDTFHLTACNLSGAKLENISVDSLSLVQNNLNNINGTNLKLNSYSTYNKQSHPLFIKQFSSGQKFIIYQHQIVNENSEIILEDDFTDCQVDEFYDTFYVKTLFTLFCLKNVKDQISTQELKVKNILSISKFDQIMMLFQIEGKNKANIIELDLKSSEVLFKLQINEEDIIKFNIQQFYQMEGNQILFSTHSSLVQSAHYQIENGKVVFDNPITHIILKTEDPIRNIRYYKTLDITVVTFEDPVYLKPYDIIYGTINQLAGKFIQLKQCTNQFLYLNQNVLQLINQETFKVSSEYELKSQKYKDQNICSYQSKNTLLLQFNDQVLVMTLSPFELLKTINVCAIDILINSLKNSITILAEFEAITYDLKYLEDRQIQVVNQFSHFENIVFTQSNLNFLAQLSNNQEIIFATVTKKGISYKTIAQIENPEGIFLSNDENSMILRDKSHTIFYDLKNNTANKFVKFIYEKILWIKDNQNFYFFNDGIIEEFKSSIITIKNKLLPKPPGRQIVFVQSTQQHLLIHTSTQETIVINEEFIQQEITAKQMIKRYREYYITPHDLRLENNKTITIHYKSSNIILDFWVFPKTILIKQQEGGSEMTALVLLDKKNYSIIDQLLVQVDFIEYTEDQIQIISNKTYWLTYSCYDLMLLQSQILSVNTLFFTSNAIDQLMIVSQFSEITIWDTVSFKITYQQKYAELIQFVKMISKRQNEYYVADRDVLKLFVQNQMKFSIQLNKKRKQILVNNNELFYSIYQIEEDKITLSQMSEDPKVMGWKKIIFELDQQREQIECFDNKDHRLVYFGNSKIQLVFLDAFEDSKVLEVPQTFKCIQIKFNKDCTLIYLRSNEKIVIVEALNLAVTNSIIFKDIIPRPFHYENHMEMFSLGLNNILLKYKRKNHYCLYNYSTLSQKIDLISFSNYNQFIGVNAQGLIVVDQSNSAIDIYQPKISDSTTNTTIYLLQQSFNKSNMAHCSQFDNLLDQSQLIIEKEINIASLWQMNEEVDLLISF